MDGKSRMFTAVINLLKTGAQKHETSAITGTRLCFMELGLQHTLNNSERS